MNPALLQKGSNSFRTDSEIKDHEGTVYNYWRDANNYQQVKNTCFYKIIHLSIQFSAIVNRFIVKTKLTSAFTNDLKRKENYSKNVHCCIRGTKHLANTYEHSVTANLP